MGLIGIPIWTKSSTSLGTISEPGTYYLHCTIAVPKSGVLSPVGQSFSLFGWFVRCTDVRDDDKGGSTITIVVGGDQQKGVNESALSPLQISALLGIGLLAAFALFIDRIEKASPILTTLIYGFLVIVLIVLYKKFVQKKK